MPPGAVMRRSRFGESIIPGRAAVEWFGFDKRGKKDQRGQQTRESPAHFPAPNTPYCRRRSSFGSGVGKQPGGWPATAGAGRKKGIPQRSKSQESSCGARRCNSRPWPRSCRPGVSPWGASPALASPARVTGGGRKRGKERGPQGPVAWPSEQSSEGKPRGGFGLKHGRGQRGPKRRQEGEIPCRRPGRIRKIRHPPQGG